MDDHDMCWETTRVEASENYLAEIPRYLTIDNFFFWVINHPKKLENRKSEIGIYNFNCYFFIYIS